MKMNTNEQPSVPHLGALSTQIREKEFNGQESNNCNWILHMKTEVPNKSKDSYIKFLARLSPHFLLQFMMIGGFKEIEAEYSSVLGSIEGL